MTQQGPSAPRRAFGPPSEGTPESSDSTSGWTLDDETRPQRAIPLSDEASSPSSPSDSVILRRLAPSSGRAGRSGEQQRPAFGARAFAGPATADVVPTTPVPPPAPVLPDPPALPASAGRRFSAAEPLDTLDTGWVAPRRSATSVTSPPSSEEVGSDTVRRSLDDTIRRTAPGAAAEPGAAPVPAAVDEKPAAGGGPRRSRRALIVIAAVALVGLVVAGAVWALSLGGPGAPAASSSPPTASATVLDRLITTADLAVLGDRTWTSDSESTSPTEGAPRPLCLPFSSGSLPSNQSSGMRHLTSDKMSVLHYVNTFEDDVQAGAAYGERVAQIGTCPDTQALIVDGYDVSGLGDDSIASTVVVQSDPAEYHTLLVNRSGRTINLFDVTSADKPASAGNVVKAAAGALSRQCASGDAPCPTTPKAKKGLPAAGGLPGWLVEADLPRVTLGAGRWGATEPVKRLSVVGSQCEAIDLNNVTGTTETGQRTFLLADDPAAPTGFGIDQAVYTFARQANANALAKKLTDNIKSCARRTPTAEVSGATTIKGTGKDGVAIAGTSYRVSQKVDANRVLLFRVTVLTVGNHVGYLLANPSSGFDFTDAAWSAVAVRAGQRISQGA